MNDCLVGDNGEEMVFDEEGYGMRVWVLWNGKEGLGGGI